MPEIEAGDRVTYIYLENNNKTTLIVGCKAEANDLQDMQKEGHLHQIKILKIERPTYTVVEEKKELLIEEERNFLKLALKFTNSNATYIAKTLYGLYLLHKNDKEIENGKAIYIDYIGHGYFSNLEFRRKYTLSELGLEE